MKPMTDWGLSELEDIDWDEFGKSDDHIVPRQGGELPDESVTLHDAHKKPRYGVVNDVQKGVLNKASATKAVFWRKKNTYFPSMENGSPFLLEEPLSHVSNIIIPTSRDPKRIDEVTALSSQDAGISGYCVTNCSTDTKNNTFCSNGHDMGTRISTNAGNVCSSSLNGVSPDVTDLCFSGNEGKDRGNDLPDYDWTDICNFEDIDKMFSWDSMPGQGHIGTADELSWFSSSSHAIYGQEIAFEPGLQSSSSESVLLNGKSEHANINLMPKSVTKAVNHDNPSSSGHQSYADWLDCHAQNNANSAAMEKMGTHHSSEEKRNEWSTDQMLLDSEVSAPQPHPCQLLSHQKDFKGSASSSYMNILNHHVLAPPDQVSFPQSTSRVVKFEDQTKPASSYKASDHVVNHPIQCMERSDDKLYTSQTMALEENIKQLHKRRPSCATIITEHRHQQAYSRSKVSAHKKQLETRGDRALKDAGLQLPAVELASSVAQKSSCMTSDFSDDILLKATSFQQLQNFMHQLDVRTKLCIRDSLYRLAKSAKQRHSFPHTNNCSSKSINTIRIQGTEASNKRGADFIYPEATTNPIDRSIANLLFSNRSESKTADNAASLQFHAMNEQLHLPRNTQSLVANHFDHQGLLGICSDLGF